MVVDMTGHGCWAETTKTTYIVPGTVLRHKGEAAKGDDGKAMIGELPPGENAISLRQGDRLILTRDRNAGSPGDLRQRRAGSDPRRDRLHDSGGIR